MGGEVVVVVWVVALLVVVVVDIVDVVGVVVVLVLRTRQVHYSNQNEESKSEGKTLNEQTRRGLSTSKLT